jgi:bacterioferritin-associated ferredoxin
MFVCLCYGVTDKAIKHAVRAQGAGNLRELKENMDIGSNCGKCVQLIQQIIDETVIDESLFKNVG